MDEQRPVIVWYRNDLRIDDHEPLRVANQWASGRVIPVYCVDPRGWEDSPLGFCRTGARRTQLLIESLRDLRASLRALGSDLVIARGRPEVELPRIASETAARAVMYHEEATTEEREVERALDLALDGVTRRAFWGHTLYHRDDVPFALDELPEVFTHARKKMEKHATIRPPVDAPVELGSLPAGVQPGELPTLDELGLVEPERDLRAAFSPRGGEAAARDRLEAYFFAGDHLREYKETRNGLVGLNYSSKFAPWLSMGNISPRRVAWEVKRYERERVSNKSTYWLIFELIWRDYFRFLAAQQGSQLFEREGIQHTRYKWSEDREAFERWRTGRTGVPFVDSNMIELARTGFMSNRGRQNVASFLAKTLQIDWRWGAWWFESALLDYDPCSNWGNWQYVAGVGSDPRDRKFNVIQQGRRYDEWARHIKLWLPQLADLPAPCAHEPWRMSRQQLAGRFGVRIGVDYPEPMVEDEWMGIVQVG